MSQSHSARETELAARRRLVLLAGILAISLLPLAMGTWHAWPLLGLPVVLSFVLAGPVGLGIVSSVAALAMAMVSAHPGADGTSLTTAFLAFVSLGIVVGLHNFRLEHALGREAQRSMTDKLTGLPNYAFLSEALPLELRRSDRTGGDVSLVLLDLDGFKAFNDRFGHEAGNRMLVAVAGAMKETARGSDVVGRFGGEEFAVIVSGGAHDALEAAERVRSAIAAVSITLDGGMKVGVTTSAGVAERHRGETMEALIKRSDEALYAAKAAGRDRVVVAPADELTRRRRVA